MELKHLRAFVALAEELHFGRAARRLSIVQPALSMQIKTLEEELGAQLFERDRHRVALTSTGRLFFPEAAATLHQASRAEQTARLSAQGEIGTLRIAFVSSVLPKLLPALIRTMHARYPLITLALKDMPTPDQISALRNNKLDFGLIRLPVTERGLEIRVVQEESFVVALPEDHALTAQPAVRPGDLRGFPAFILARAYAPGFHDETLVALQRAGADLNIAQELGEFSTMLALVSAGLGVGIMPAAAASARPPRVVARPLELDGHKASIGLAYRAGDDPVKRALLDAMQRCVEDQSDNL